MTGREEIERLLNQTGRTLEGLPEQYSYYELANAYDRCKAMPTHMICHQADVIELLVGALREALAKVPRWVGAEERLPEEKTNPLTNDFEDVICACDFGGIPKRRDVRVYKFGYGHFFNGFQVMDSVVTHWMSKPELPEPTKEDA